MVDLQAVYEAIITVLENEEAQKTFVSAIQSAAVVGAATVCSALFLGPIGILGGGVASVGMYWKKRNTFKSIIQVIQNDLTPAQKIQLSEHVEKVIRSFRIRDAAMLLALAKKDVAFKQTVTKAVISFFQSDGSLLEKS